MLRRPAAAGRGRGSAQVSKWTSTTDVMAVSCLALAAGTVAATAGGQWAGGREQGGKCTKTLEYTLTESCSSTSRKQAASAIFFETDFFLSLNR